MTLLRRRPALDAELLTELSGLRDGSRPRVLRWAEGDRGVLVVLADALAVRRREGWLLAGWHEVASGGWNAADAQLEWALLDGRRGRMRLRDPGRLPEVFRERVEASVVVRRDHVDPATGAGFTISARRPVGGGRGEPGAETVEWHASLHRGTSWNQPGLTERVARTMAAVRSEYDFPG